ncbi:MAG TPA: hypothetical protein VIM42_11615 [Clostridium sp.]
MKRNKILAIIISLIIISSGGYLYYNHSQKVAVEQSNSNKSHALNSAKNWKNSLKSNFDLSIDLVIIRSQMVLYKDTDIDTYNKLKVSYGEIAEYLNTTEKHLDEICSMNQDDSEKEIGRLLNAR